MGPGRELDAAIADKVMGFKEVGPHDYLGKQELMYLISDYPRQFWKVPAYSTDIAAAWTVVEKLGLFRDKQTDRTDGYSDYVQLWQDPDGTWRIGDWEDQLFILAAGDTAPHAICLAALKSMTAI